MPPPGFKALVRPRRSRLSCGVIDKFIDLEIYGNSAGTWLAAVAIALLAGGAVWVVVRVVARRLGRIAEQTDTRVDDMILAVVGETRAWFMLVVGLYAGLLLLNLPEPATTLARRAALLVFLLQAGIWVAKAAAFTIDNEIERRKDEDRGTATTLHALSFLARIVIWSVVVLLILDNFGVNITALVAGLGVGGVAVALAVQNILGDLFASLSIVLDKPFVIGDFLVVGDMLGTVESIGLKTTRLRSLSGEQLVFSNNDLLSSRIRNYGRMSERRVVFSVGVVYQTSLAAVREIPDILRAAVAAQSDTRFDRAHFKEFGDFALMFEVVYYMTHADYMLYMDCQQAINLAIFEAFADKGIEFAYPTQTLHMPDAPLVERSDT